MEHLHTSQHANTYCNTQVTTTTTVSSFFPNLNGSTLDPLEHLDWTLSILQAIPRI
jgi:hypothetical protein